MIYFEKIPFSILASNWYKEEFARGQDEPTLIFSTKPLSDCQYRTSPTKEPIKVQTHREIDRIERYRIIERHSK